MWKTLGLLDAKGKLGIQAFSCLASLARFNNCFWRSRNYNLKEELLFLYNIGGFCSSGIIMMRLEVDKFQKDSTQHPVCICQYINTPTTNLLVGVITPMMWRRGVHNSAGPASMHVGPGAHVSVNTTPRHFGIKAYSLSSAAAAFSSA